MRRDVRARRDQSRHRPRRGAHGRFARAGDHFIVCKLDRLARNTQHLLEIVQRLEARVAHSGQLLGALSYRGVLARGFALVRDEQGHAVHTAASVGPGARLDLEFSDGRVAATADADRPAAPAPENPPKPAARETKPAASKRVVKPVGQGSLF